MELLRRVSEGLARKTSRRGLFSRGAEVATGTLLGVAAGTLTRPGPASAGHLTVCAFPGPACPCGGCNETGACAKPCIIMTFYYASGCWVSGSYTCCDCDCQGMPNDVAPTAGHGPSIGSPINVCGCGSDFHNNASLCP